MPFGRHLVYTALSDVAYATRSPVLFIVGPTAVGKTRLGIALAQQFQGEVINADSRQVYRGMEIGTAKPTPEERRQAQHHLLDLLDPAEDFSLGAFLTLARDCIVEIDARGHLPIVVGGTGQYIWALAQGWQVPAVLPDPQFRQEKERQAAEQGPMALYRELAALDPVRAAQLDPRNVRRVIRALEVRQAQTHGRTETSPPAVPAILPCIIGLTLSREELYHRIDVRVDAMMAAGFLEEAQRLVSQGHKLGAGALACPGYRELGQHLAGEIPLAEAVQRTKFQTHRMARRQYTWFKLDDPRIHWLDASDPGLTGLAAAQVQPFLSAKAACDTIARQPSQEAEDAIHQNARSGQ
ncbi:MAG: tRNA (adenosine(37)-N6)-dimethylallyltransferase MiaA [SAR202 cluster bacterium]|nr:tRNA (adenosine(37)-N6)-dimethylallyltransferase MiaA [SAR202 cluster bacterium]